MSTQKPSKTLYVKNIPFTATEEDIKNFFEGFLVEVTIIKMKNGRSKGYAFVTFESIEYASSAITMFNGKEMNGREISIDYSKQGISNDAQQINEWDKHISTIDGTIDVENKNQTLGTITTVQPIRPIQINENKSETDLFLSNLPFRITKNEIMALFNKYQPNSVKILKKFVDGKRKPSGNAIVYLPNHEQQVLAISELKGKVNYQGRTITIQAAIIKNEQTENLSQTAIFISNVSETVVESDCVEYFMNYNPINIEMKNHNVKNHTKTFIIQFETEENQRIAIQEKNNTNLKGKNISVKKANKKDELEQLQPEIHHAKLNIFDYLMKRQTQYDYNGKSYQIQLSNGISIGTQFLVENEGTPYHGIQRNLIIQLDYDNVNGTYEIRDNDVYQYVFYDRKYRNQQTLMEITIATGDPCSQQIIIEENYSLYLPNFGLKDENGIRGNYYIVVKLGN